MGAPFTVEVKVLRAHNCTGLDVDNCIVPSSGPSNNVHAEGSVGEGYEAIEARGKVDWNH